MRGLLDREGNLGRKWKADLSDEGEGEADRLRSRPGPLVHVPEVDGDRVTDVALNYRTRDRAHCTGVRWVLLVEVPGVHLAIVRYRPCMSVTLVTGAVPSRW